MTAQSENHPTLHYMQILNGLKNRPWVYLTCIYFCHVFHLIVYEETVPSDITRLQWMFGWIYYFKQAAWSLLGRHIYSLSVQPSPLKFSQRNCPNFFRASYLSQQAPSVAPETNSKAGAVCWGPA